MTIEELKSEIREAQTEMEMANDEGDFTLSHELEAKIIELQNQLFRLKSVD